MCQPLHIILSEACALMQVFPIIFLQNQIYVLVDFVPPYIHSVSKCFTLTAGITHGLHRPENYFWSEYLLFFPTSERCPQWSDQNDPVMLVDLLVEYLQECF